MDFNLQSDAPQEAYEVMGRDGEGKGYPILCGVMWSVLIPFFGSIRLLARPMA